MPEKQLYFIALIPDQHLRDRVKLLKEEIKNHFNAKHALKSPAHITLQMPFRKDKNTEAKFIEILHEFALKQTHFSINLSGFECFGQSTIYLKVVNHVPIINLHSELFKTFKNKLNFEPNELSKIIYPHMTIATRDLDRTNFRKAWIKFKERPFETQFTSKSIFLLKHNGKYWDIHRECFFGN